MSKSNLSFKNRIIHLTMINPNRRLMKRFLQVMHKRIVAMLLILLIHQNQTELSIKTDFVSIMLSLVIALLNVKVLVPFALLKIIL